MMIVCTSLPSFARRTTASGYNYTFEYFPTEPAVAAIAGASHADMAIVCTATTSGEGHDRHNLSLPFEEDELTRYANVCHTHLRLTLTTFITLTTLTAFTSIITLMKIVPDNVIRLESHCTVDSNDADLVDCLLALSLD